MVLKNANGIKLIETRDAVMDLKVGEVGYIAPWSIHIDKAGRVYLDVTCYMFRKNPNTFFRHVECVVVKKLGVGDYELDFKYVNHRHWSAFSSVYNKDDMVEVGQLENPEVINY